MKEEELEKKVSEWIYGQQLKSEKKSNLLKTMEASDKLEALGIEGFQKKLGIDKNEARFAFYKASDLIEICLDYYHQQEMGVYFND